MPKKKTAKKTAKQVESLAHKQARRRHIPTAEYQSLLDEEQRRPQTVTYARNPDLDPQLIWQCAEVPLSQDQIEELKEGKPITLEQAQLIWRGKDKADLADLIVDAPPLYIQEKVQPKALIDDLRRESEQSEAERANQETGFTEDFFADFNGLSSEAAKTEFYQHEANWSNRMILGDSLQVIASLAGREGLRGRVQCIYLDPPYGIKFNSNFQFSTASRDVKDGKPEHITREPEQVKAFRDTWRDGIHSYLSYLRDRLTVARDLLTESGSIFVQIGDENVHRVRCLMDEVFGDENFVSLITIQKMAGLGSQYLKGACDYVIYFGRDATRTKYRQLFFPKVVGKGHGSGARYDQVIDPFGNRLPIKKVIDNLAKFEQEGWHVAQPTTLTTFGSGGSSFFPVNFQGVEYLPAVNKGWLTHTEGIKRLEQAGRIIQTGNSIRYVRRLADHPSYEINNIWTDIASPPDLAYVVQTSKRLIERCLLMTTDPGDLVLDPTCGSGTTAYVAEQWGRRWITIDTSRVALALARARLMGARYPYYLLADSADGRAKEQELAGKAPSTTPAGGDIRLGFVYERAPHITLKSIANNAEIDVIWERFQETLAPLRAALNAALGEQWEEWQVPREADADWPAAAKQTHADWWAGRLARQQAIDAAITHGAAVERLYDRPYEDRRRVRVAGPFTVESALPYRALGVGADDELLDPLAALADEAPDFVAMILENLKAAGVQQAHKEDKLDFSALEPWPGKLICAEGTYSEADGAQRHAAVFIGPEFGTVARRDLMAAAREAVEAGFDALIACAFNYDAHLAEVNKLGRLPILKARMNADLHMAGELKNTDKANLFVIFGEPDIEIETTDKGQLRVRIIGVDVFDPAKGEIRSDNTDGIACWFIDTDYNEESFFVRHAYFLGANDPYKSLKTTLQAEINEAAWASLHSDVSRPFDKPASGRIAVKVINRLGDEVMKVFGV